MACITALLVIVLILVALDKATCLFNIYWFIYLLKNVFSQWANSSQNSSSSVSLIVQHSVTGVLNCFTGWLIFFWLCLILLVHFRVICFCSSRGGASVLLFSGAIDGFADFSSTTWFMYPSDYSRKLFFGSTGNNVVDATWLSLTLALLFCIIAAKEVPSFCTVKRDDHQSVKTEDS